MSVTRKDILRKLRESTHYSGCAENAEKAGISASEILNFLVDELDHQYDRAQHYLDRAIEAEKKDYIKEE